MNTQPLSPMTAALQALIEQQRALDQRELDESGERFRTRGEREMNLQAIGHLERAMACVAADKPRDALIQVLVAAGHAQALEQEACEQPLAEELAIVSRLLRFGAPGARPAHRGRPRGLRRPPLRAPAAERDRHQAGGTAPLFRGGTAPCR